MASSSGRRFPADATAIAGWLPAAPGGRGDDLSLGFNAGAASAGPGAGSLAAGLWGPAASRQAAAGDVGMLVVAPVGSFHHQRAAAAAAAADPVFPLVARGLLPPPAGARDDAGSGGGGAHGEEGGGRRKKVRVEKIQYMR